MMISNWVDAAVNGTALIAPGYDGINSLSISNAMYLSTWNDNWVDLPFDEDEYLSKLNERIESSTFKKNALRKLNDDFSGSYSK
jgi:hypothetical protein